MTDIVELYGHWELVNNGEFDALIKAFANAHLTTSDLLVMARQEIVSKCRRSINEVNRFLDLFTTQLDSPLEFIDGPKILDSFGLITSGDKNIDQRIGGGFKTGSLCEIAGQSATGKSNFLIQLCIMVQLPLELNGLGKLAIHISTESGLETRRMQTMLDRVYDEYGEDWPNLQHRVNGENVLCLKTKDQEDLEHVLMYQVPVAVKRYNVGLIVIDSIASHYRSEFSKTQNRERVNSYMKITRNLRSLAVGYNIAVVVANQVTDRQPAQYPIDQELYMDELYFEQQYQWFNGWCSTESTKATDTTSIDASIDALMDSSENTDKETSYMSSGHFVLHEDFSSSPPLSNISQNSDSYSVNGASQNDYSHSVSASSGNSAIGNIYRKAPALGLMWSTCIDERIVLKRKDTSNGEIYRTLAMVFSPWGEGPAFQFKIDGTGVHSAL